MAKNRADSLQFLRFLAFLLICVFHALKYNEPWMPGGGNGAANAVEFFILLSGFVSGFSSYDKEISCTAKSVVTYVWKKIKKVYPLYIATTFITISYSGIPLMIANYSFVEMRPLLFQLVKTIILIQSWFPNGYFAFNGVSWFLSTIVFLYILNMPLRALMGAIKKKKYFKWIYGAISLGAFILVVIYCYLTRNTNMEYTQYVLPVSRLFEYVCGMSLGYLMYSVNEKVSIGKKSILKLSVFTVLEIAALSLWIANMYFPVIVWHFRIVHWVIPNVLLISVFSVGQGLVARLFKLNFLRYLGDISFECFLIHMLVIHAYITNSGLENISTLGNMFSLLFCVFGTVIISSLVHTSQKNLKY